MKMDSKESWSSNSHIRENRLKNKECYKRQRKTLHSDQGINPRRRYNNYNYICTQHRSTSIHRQLLTAIKEEIDSNTIIVGDFNTSLTPIDRSCKQKINKETQALHDTIDKIDLIDIYRRLHLKTADYTFLSSAHGSLSRIDHIVGHKSSLSKFKKIEIISSIFSNHNGVRLEINYREKT